MDERTFPQQLSAPDSLMWRIESDPVLRSPILVVGLLDRAPTPEGMEATIERAVITLPRLRQRIVGPPLGVGRPRWEDAGEPSSAHHLRWVRAPGGDLDSVLQVAQPDAVAAFDPARPPWTLTVVDGLDGGRAAIVLRFHHAITDGVGGIEIAQLLFDRKRRPTRSGRRGAAPGTAPDDAAAIAAPDTSPPGRTAPAGPPGVGVISGAASVVGQLVRGAGDVARHPGDALASSVRLGRSAARLLAPAGGDGSPALAGRSLDRWLALAERPFDQVQAAAHATGGTVNDVLLAAVAGGLSAYHRAQGQPVRAVRVTMPISLRREGDRMGGNRFVPARFTLPIDDPDPEVRVKIAGAIVRGWRAEPAIGATGLLATGLNLLPRPLVTRVFGEMLRSIDVDVVDVPGLDRRAFVGGARIDRLWAFAPPTGAALSVTLVSHTGTCCIGVACDQLAVTDPELMTDCLTDAFDELLALGRSATTGDRRSAHRRSA